jgi:hypothetical protein
VPHRTIVTRALAHRASRVVPVALAVVLGLSACGGGDDDSAAAGPAAVQPAETSAPAESPAPAETAAPAATAKVSANTASEDDIAAAFKAAGVPNPAKWADEVVEYRPYPKDDADFAKLRAKLAKYKPGAGVVDKIVAVLTA